jgi:hypothetical protein
MENQYPSVTDVCPAQASLLLGQRLECCSGDEYLSVFPCPALSWQRAYDYLICQPNLYGRRRSRWRRRSMRGEGEDENKRGV